MVVRAAKNGDECGAVFDEIAHDEVFAGGFGGVLGEDLEVEEKFGGGSGRGRFRLGRRGRGRWRGRERRRKGGRRC